MIWCLIWTVLLLAVNDDLVTLVALVILKYFAHDSHWDGVQEVQSIFIKLLFSIIIQQAIESQRNVCPQP
jgi:hypothetical protein